jgi:hypothetical protein
MNQPIKYIILSFALPIPLMVSMVLHSHFTAHYTEVLKDFKLVVANSYFLGCVEHGTLTHHECREKAKRYLDIDLTQDPEYYQ